MVQIVTIEKKTENIGLGSLAHILEQIKKERDLEFLALVHAIIMKEMDLEERASVLLSDGNNKYLLYDVGFPDAPNWSLSQVSEFKYV